MLGLKLIHVSERGPWGKDEYIEACAPNQYKDDVLPV